MLKFFLNSNSRSYLRNLESEFGESTNSIRLELNRFEEAGLLTSEFDGNKKYFSANTGHPLFSDIHNIILKQIGFDKIVETVIQKLGNLKRVYVEGDFAKGKNNSIIDLIFVSEELNREYLLKLIGKVEDVIKRKIRYLVFNDEEFNNYIKDIDISELLLLWKNEDL